MLEARLVQAGLLKRIIDAVKDVVTDCSFEFHDEGMKMQAMDSSHVSLCSLKLDRDVFETYRCDRPISLGVSLPSLAKLLRCAKDDDVLTMKADDPKDVLHLLFENKAQDKIMDFSLKLMEINEESLGIPEQEYQAKVEMDSAEFSKIIRDLSVLGDTCAIGCTKEGVKFSVEGEIGSAAITVRSSSEPAPSIDDKKKKKVQKKGTTLEISSPVDLTFALRYLKFFTQATALSSRVNFALAPDMPLMVEFPIVPMSMSDEEIEGEELPSTTNSRIQFFLAPKIDDDN